MLVDDWEASSRITDAAVGKAVDPYHDTDGSTVYSSSPEYSSGDFSDSELVDESYPDMSDGATGGEPERWRAARHDRNGDEYHSNTHREGKGSDDENMPLGVIIGRRQLQAMGVLSAASSQVADFSSTESRSKSGES